MEFGEVLPEPKSSSNIALPPAPKPRAASKSSEAALRDSIVAEIDERREFLEVMQAAGKTEHEQAVRGQIAERLNDLKRLEKLMSDE